MNKLSIPLLGVVAYSGTGKTTLLKQLIPYLKAKGVRVGLIKHTHHDVDVDTPGKDSFELRKAGAHQTMVASSQRWALMTETPEADSLDLHYLASRFDSNSLDLILVEGFKHEEIDKIVLYRQGATKAFEGLIDNNAIAVCSDTPLDNALPSLDINKIEDVGQFVIHWLNNRAR
ncbi:MAG: molybdopterin-guanine dinucleotide biosynthesis protein MobB [Ewingella sp.]|uniref:molybdopterin-guanine dinucleotide biosynthesis protein MobB n=1 Tax=Ewingella sp. TaxID=1897459 RepID=UPI003F8DBED3